MASTSAFIQEARADPGHPLRGEFDRFVAGYIEQLRTSEAFARRAEKLKRDLLARPELATLAEGAWESLRAFVERDVAAADSQIRRELAAMLVDIGGQLQARPGDPRRDQPRHGAGAGRIRAEPEERRRPIHRRPGEGPGTWTC